MQPNNQTVGSCPFCGARMPTHGVIIEYEADGEETCIAECPECGELARPV